MGLDRFDRTSRRLGARPTRRGVLRGTCAAGAAVALAAVRHQPAAADCEDGFMTCGLPHHLGGYTVVDSAGLYGRCWDWTRFVCTTCPGSVEAASARCNDRYPQACQGRCVAFAER